jgi:hypothetical protein
MSEKILTFELPQDGGEIQIHGNEEGLRELCGVLQRLLKSPKSEHDHLFTPCWGGHELTEEKQGSATDRLINKVTIYLWRQA